MLIYLLFISIIYSEKNEKFNILLNSRKIPRIIWLYWDGRLPGEVRYMLHNLKNNMDNYNIIFLTKSTTRNYLNSNLFPPTLSKYPRANQADYFRFNLLYLYGGTWLDSSTFIKNSSFLDYFIKRTEDEEKEFGGFNSFYPAPYHIELGFMISYSHTKFIYNIIKEMEYCIRIGRRKYMERRINEGIIIFSNNIYNNSNSSSPYYGEFFCFYVCLQTVVQRYYNSNPPILLFRSEDYFYKLHTHCHFKARCMISSFNNDVNNELYPIVIFTSGTRKRISFPQVDII